MPILNIQFNTTGGDSFIIGYRPNPLEYGSVVPFTEISATVSPVNITVPASIPYEFYIKKICSDQTQSSLSHGVAYPNLVCNTPSFNFISRNNNIFKFSYNVEPSQQFFEIEVYNPAGQLKSTNIFEKVSNVSPIDLTLSSLSSGTYGFRMRAYCGNPKTDVNAPVSSWTTRLDVNVLLSNCLAPSDIIFQNCSNVVILNPNDPVPYAYADQPYLHKIYLSGTDPITLTISPTNPQPSWMTITKVTDAIGNSRIEFTGTPTQANLTNNVSFEFKIYLSNCQNTPLYLEHIIFIQVLQSSFIQTFQLTSDQNISFNLLIDTNDISGTSFIPLGQMVTVTASGVGLNNPSSVIKVVIPQSELATVSSATLYYAAGGTVLGLYDIISKTFAFPGINTNITQTLQISLLK